MQRLCTPPKFTQSGDELTTTCARLGLETHRTAPRLRLIPRIVWGSVGFGHQHQEQRWSAGPRLMALLCVQHSGKVLRDTEVNRTNGYVPFTVCEGRGRCHT